MSLLKSVGSRYEPSMGGAEKARGLDNAALRHAAKLERQSATARPATSRSTTAQSAAVVTIGAADGGPGNYTRQGAAAGTGASAATIGGDAALHVHQGLGAGAAPRVVAPANVPSTSSVSALTLGDDANVHINQRGTSGGSGSLIVGDDANVHINQRGTSGGSGSLIVGDNANVHINQRGTSGGSGSLIVGDDANVHINQRGTSGGSGSLIAGEGVNLRIDVRRGGDTGPVVAADATSVTANTLAARSASAGANALTETTVVSNSLVANSQANDAHSRVQFNQQERYKQIIEGLDDAERTQKLTSHANDGRHLGRGQASHLDPKLQMLKLLVEKTLGPTDNSQVDAKRSWVSPSQGAASAEASITEGSSSSARTAANLLAASAEVTRGDT